MIVFPNAKINIGLNVVSKREDGYHNLETIFYPVKLCDALEMVEAKETLLTVSGFEIDGKCSDNLVLKAYRLLRNDFSLPPLHFHLHKVIPYGAGLGGGSADAAFTLKMLNDYFELNIPVEKLERYAAKIGADCPFFIQNKAVFAEGIGNEFTNIELNLSAFKVVIVKPNVSVGTPQAYKNVSPQKPAINLQELVKTPVENWKETVVNDFEKSVFPQFPEIEKLKNLLYDTGAVYASMSGSGSAVFGWFRETPSVLADKLQPGYFVFTG